MKSTKVVIVIDDWFDCFARFVELLFRAGHKDQYALIRRSDIQSLAKAVEILNNSLRLIEFDRVLRGDRIHLPSTRRALSEDLTGRPARSSQPVIAVGCQHTKGGVFEAAIQESSDPLRVLLAFVGVDTNADKFTGNIDELFRAEQTVLRTAVAGSEYAGNSAALRRRRHEEDRPAAPFRLGLAGVPGRVPSDAGVAEVKR